MQVIPPITITDAMLTSHSVAEPDTGETAWTNTTYALGAVRIRTATHRKYECVSAIGTATGINPEDDATHWLDIGPTNRWACFDLERNTQTEETTSPLTITLTPGVRFDSVALLGIEADSVEVSVEADAVEVYNYTEDLLTRETTGWYSYFFGAFKQRAAVVCWDIPPYTNNVVTVTLTKSSGSVKLGALVLGMEHQIGSVRPDAEIDGTNYSTIERGIAGEATLVARRNVPAVTLDVYATRGQLNRLRLLKDELNATPAVWAGVRTLSDQLFESFLLLGIYRRWRFRVPAGDYIDMPLELEEI